LSDPTLACPPRCLRHPGGQGRHIDRTWTTPPKSGLGPLDRPHLRLTWANAIVHVRPTISGKSLFAPETTAGGSVRAQWLAVPTSAEISMKFIDVHEHRSRMIRPTNSLRAPPHLIMVYLSKSGPPKTPLDAQAGSPVPTIALIARSGPSSTSRPYRLSSSGCWNSRCVHGHRDQGTLPRQLLSTRCVRDWLANASIPNQCFHCAFDAAER
jgi:hypothetical protein